MSISGYVLLTDSPVVLIQRDGKVMQGVPAVLPMTVETMLRKQSDWYKEDPHLTLDYTPTLQAERKEHDFVERYMLPVVTPVYRPYRNTYTAYTQEWHDYITQGMSWSGEQARRNYESDLDVTPWSDAHQSVMFDDYDAHDRWSNDQ